VRQTRRLSGTEIDWQPIRERLAQVAAASQEALQLSPERVKRILEERARRLAQPPAETGAPGAAISVLAFALAGERYAIETRHVREVLRDAGVIRVPGVPEFVAGVTNLRGEILAVFDLRRFLGLQTKEAAARPAVIVCGEARVEFGILADSVSDVMRLPAAELLADPVFDDKNERQFIRGVTRTATVVLDGLALMGDRRLFIDQPRGARTPYLERGA
jgi:purine-binding chemotaxis protein CheW